MKTKTFTLLLNKSLLSKLALIALLLTGGGNCAWGDDIVIYDEGSTIPDGWTNNNLSIVDNKLVAPDMSSCYITSTSTYTFSNKRFVIVAKRTSETDSYVRISNSSGYWTYMNFGYGTTTSSYEMFSTDYMELVSDPYTVSENLLRITCKNVIIKSIKICDGKVLQLDEDNLVTIPNSKTAKTESVFLKYSAKAGWNTICVPFQLKYASTFEHLTSIFGSDWKAYSLSSYSDNTLCFTNASPKSYSTITAHVPLIVYAPNAISKDNIELTSNVTISFVKDENHATTADGATFQGTYAPKEYQDGDNWYGVTTAGQVMKAGTGAKVKGYRAYFTGISAPAAGAHISIAIDDDGGTTDLGFVKLIDENANDVYTLSGQKVKKGGKGIYIVNGRKVIIK